MNDNTPYQLFQLARYGDVLPEDDQDPNDEPAQEFKESPVPTDTIGKPTTYHGQTLKFMRDE